MTDYTERDKVWSAALKCGRRGAFDVEECLFVAGLDRTSERAARDVLNTMVELGHLNSSLSPQERGTMQWHGTEIEQEELREVPVYPQAFGNRHNEAAKQTHEDPSDTDDAENTVYLPQPMG